MKKVIIILLKIEAVVERSEDKYFRAPVGTYNRRVPGTMLY